MELDEARRAGERRRRQRCRVDVLLKVKRGKGSEILREGRSYQVGYEVSRCDRKRRRSGVRRKMEDATLKLADEAAVKTPSRISK